MTTFNLTINTDNDAFNANEEIPRLLEEIAGAIRIGKASGVIRDTNGNTVGNFTHS